MPYDILVVDDEADIRELICDGLKDEGYSTRVAANSLEAFHSINEKVPSAIILDIWLQGSELDGLGILEIIKHKYPYLPVIMISGHGTIETAITSIKMGAYDYIVKPFTEDKLHVVVQRACETSKLLKENSELKLKVRDKTELIGTSSAMNNLKNTIEKVAPTAGRILITGPAGSGKELVARIIHKKSKRSNEPFLTLNSAGMSSDKIHLELFGEEHKNNLYDAPRKVGILELANHGTLFIDEVSDLPLPAQNKILRFLQDSVIERPGNAKPLKLDVRVIASTSKDLQEEIKIGKFRQDLFYRLNVIPVKIPSLAERKDDIPLLCEFFIKNLEKTSGLIPRKLGEDTIAAMQAYNWPGNIRQLHNVLEWLLIMSQETQLKEPIRVELLPPEILSGGVKIIRPDASADVMSMPLREAREVFERQYLLAQMSRFNGNISRTSSFVGMERSALHRKLKSLNISTTSANNNFEDEKVMMSSWNKQHEQA
ncbi:Nitrogen regulation protein NR(I) [Rickettsiales bacterium Ac37b]|nr:Nitrogen regulation protein NR(I) [Rickettsiales bacterium Ac37b]